MKISVILWFILSALSLATGKADTIPVPAAQYQIVAVSSDNENHPAAYAMDDDTATWWALYNAAGYSLPGVLILDLGDTLPVSGFSYLPNVRNPATRADSFAFFVSNDPGLWGDPVATGIFDWLDENDLARRKVFFGPVKGRYVKIMYLTNTHPSSDNVHTNDLVIYRSEPPPAEYRINQWISFPHIPEQFTRDSILRLEAISSSGLPVSFRRISGPVHVSHDTLYFVEDGSGPVCIEATVSGNDTLYPATVIRCFRLTDLSHYYPVIATHLSEQQPVYMPELKGYPLWFSASIAYPGQIHLGEIAVTIDGESVTAYREGDVVVVNWMPDHYGTYDIHVTAFADNGNATAHDYLVTVVREASSTTVRALDHVLINFPSPGQVARDTMHVPQFTGAYSRIIGHFSVTCPGIAGGCDDWDRVARVQVLSPEGQWIEIIRYITPYGIPCDHTLDLTDYVSLLQGDVPWKLSIGTWGTGGWEVTLDLEYVAGKPNYPYSHVYLVWNGHYPFGDPANLQPVPEVSLDIHDYGEKAFLDLVTTGHGWGQNNTDNAAEFYHAVHHIYVNGHSYEQDLWQQCNPNPDNCTGQHGTWYYDRAGWCPGSLAKRYRYDLSDFIYGDTVTLSYIFDTSYVDLCHPHNPACVSGVTCPNCLDGFNPVYYVSANLVVFSNRMVTTLGESPESPGDPEPFPLEIYPNPVKTHVHFLCEEPAGEINLTLMDSRGRIAAQYRFHDNNSLSAFTLDMTERPAGVWFIGIRNGERTGLYKVIKQ